ncbi:Shedu immune nuclease family protein [Janthinobacterium sp. YR213]|uniref:Shedu immune nuclease family protein n=1 Tax=Janthinobacterium sp. YR213 TaxID=1881027 RepID=UPI0008800685|nr:Shedu immune nuclease family protein [Janthinobacterium sp. YR213]SDG77016.1 protein of unknown function [Janthinobacterium sp. YR213]
MAKVSVEFEALGEELHLIYRPRDDDSWVHRKFNRQEELIIKGTYHLTRSNFAQIYLDELEARSEVEGDELSWMYDNEMRFTVATAADGYFVFYPDILRVGVPILIARDAEPTWKWFSTEAKTSILSVAAKLMPSRIVIGGDAPDAIPVTEYERLVHQFPTGYELKRYVVARVSAVLRQYTDASVDGELMLRRYLTKRIKTKPASYIQLFREAEVAKFEFLYSRLKEMLSSEDGYTEYVWQEQILDVVRLLNAKYIAAFKSVPLKDVGNTTDKQLDILLVDAAGNVDVIEIKQPFRKCVMTESLYRGNHIPLRELTGSIMQIEKYIFHLCRWGTVGETYLTNKYADRLPVGLQIKITNPCGIIIMGRDHEMTDVQRRDFEVFRRQNKNIIDIITYDDLLRRLQVVIQQFKAGR